MWRQRPSSEALVSVNVTYKGPHTPSWQTRALKPKPYSGWPWIQLCPIVKLLCIVRKENLTWLHNHPKKHPQPLLSRRRSVKGFSSKSSQVKKTKNHLRVLIQHIIPSINQVNKRLPTPVFCDSVSERFEKASWSVLCKSSRHHISEYLGRR